MFRNSLVKIGRALAIGALVPSSLYAQSVRENLWATNGTVHAMAYSNNGLYFGGDFTRVGPPTGGYAGISLSSGATLQPYFQVNGQVHAQVSDGNGGWFIGGEFTSVRGIPRKSLAHIDQYGNVTSWDPNNGNPQAVPTIWALARSGQTVYVGGYFNHLGTESRNALGSVDATTGVVSSWAPIAAINQSILAFYISGSTLYVGGSFGIFGQNISNLAAFDLTDGSLLPWNPDVVGAVSCLSPSPDASYLVAGGEFTQVGGVSRTRLAMVHKTSAAVLPDWDPAPNNTVRAVASDLSAIYVAGNFTQIAFVTRNRIAAIHPTTGSALSFNPNADGQVSALAVKNDGFGSPSTIYAGGQFQSIGGVERLGFAVVNEAGTVSSFAPACGDVRTIALTSSAVFVGGNMTMVGSVPRTNLAAINVTSGAPTDWSPSVTGGYSLQGPKVQALAVYGNTVFVGGNYTAINGAFHDCFAALDALTGVPHPWNLNTGSAVTALALNGSHLYMGGYFGGIGGVNRSYAACIDAMTGAVLPWAPSFNSFVYALSIRSSFSVGQSTIFAGGQFTAVNGVSRWSIAAINEAGGVTSWVPETTTFGEPVYAIRFMPIGQFGGGTVWVGGDFGIGPGGLQRYLAALDASTGALKSWNPNANGPVRALQVYNGTLLVGGTFSDIGGQARYGVARLDMTTAQATPWDAELLFGTPAAYALFATGDNVYVGGYFLTIRDAMHTNFGALSGNATPTAVEEEPMAEAPRRTVLHASPNPFEQETTLRFALPRGEKASIRVYDVTGRLVRTLHRGMLGAGEHALRWDGTNDRGSAVGSGIYFLRVDAPSRRLKAKAFRLK